MVVKKTGISRELLIHPGETIAEVYKQFSRVGKYEQFPSKYANYWAIYMRDDLFSSYIQNRMYEYFD